MTRHYKLMLAAATLLFLSENTYAQVPAIPNASGFAVFTGSGAINNTGTTTINGSLGTHSGGIKGDPLIVLGQSHINDQTAINAETDLTTIFSNLGAIGGACTNLGTPFGNGATLTPGTYCLGSAGDLTGDLTLDGGGVVGSVFIIKIGGALTATNVNIILTGLASRNNVYFVVDGAVNLNQTATPATSIFRGNVIARDAINLTTGAIVEGKLLSATGAISLLNNTISASETVLPVTLTSFTAKKSEAQTTVINWTTTAETNSDRFEIQRSNNGKLWNQLATISAKGESATLTSYQYTDAKPENGTNLYRLKMIDKDETFAFSRIQSVEFKMLSKTVLFPNPMIDLLTLNVDDISLIQRIQISNIFGANVYDMSKVSSDLSTNLNVKNLPAGMYIVRVTNNMGNVVSTKIVKQ